MRSALDRFRLLSIISLAALIFAFSASAQSKRARSDQKKNTAQSEAEKTDQKKNPGQSEVEKTDQQDVPLKIETDLVTVPVIATDRAEVYVHDLVKDEFTVYEDGIKQEIEFFGAVRAPFTMTLMLDTSASAQEKLARIQRAAKTFLEQLQPADRLKIISFDEGVSELSAFTNDRAELLKAIDSTKPGKGTKLYDAVRFALNDLSRVKAGRKAIIIFTDGVDSYSGSTTYGDNIRQLEESSVVVYPIRYDTRYETEALLRQQQERGETVDLGAVLSGSRGPTGATPPTVPGGKGSPVPSERSGQNIPMRLPIPPIITGGGRYPDRFPGGGRVPDDRYPPDRYPPDRNPPDRIPGGGRYPDDRYPPDRYPDNRYPDSRNPNPPRRGDSNISVMLDNLYRTADQYLGDLALKSGGELYRADTLGSLPDAFANIVAELRNQYSLGYYPANQTRDGKYRKIQVKVSRKQVVIRSRPGYRAPAADSSASK